MTQLQTFLSVIEATVSGAQGKGKERERGANRVAWGGVKHPWACKPPRQRPHLSLRFSRRRGQQGRQQLLQQKGLGAQVAQMQQPAGNRASSTCTFRVGPTFILKTIQAALDAVGQNPISAPVAICVSAGVYPGVSSREARAG